MPNYTIWTMHDEIGVNVLQENDDDVDMPNVAIHDADEEILYDMNYAWRGWCECSLF